MLDAEGERRFPSGPSALLPAASSGQEGQAPHLRLEGRRLGLHLGSQGVTCLSGIPQTDSLRFGGRSGSWCRKGLPEHDPRLGLGVGVVGAGVERSGPLLL